MGLLDFFEAKSVAVVGASRHKGKVGYQVTLSLVRDGFEGPIWPINPVADEIEGRKCYADLELIGACPDLVIVAVPARAVPEVFVKCGRLGVKNVILISSGFQETGAEGRKLQDQVLQIARESGIRMLGPNCLGIMVPSRKLNASFGGVLPKPGPIGYFSQSGSLLAAMVDMARAKGIGFSRLISMGNKADINELDVLRALGKDPQTKVIAGYLETIADGDAFIREAERISRTKPILLMKAGETGAGGKAASSHTGRLAESQQAYQVVFERAGIIRCQSITAQFDYARALTNQPLPPGRRMVVIANAGGPGIMATDAMEQQGLELACFAEETTAKLASKLPSGANIGNPIDVLGDALADRFEFALDTALADPNVDGAVVLLTPHAMTECVESAAAIVRVAKARAGAPGSPAAAVPLAAGDADGIAVESRAAGVGAAAGGAAGESEAEGATPTPDAPAPLAVEGSDVEAGKVEGVAKPILACFLGAGRVHDAIEVLREGGIPNFESPEFGVAALKVMVDYGRWRSRPKRIVRLFPVNRRKVEKVVNQHLRLGQMEVGETEGKEMLEAYGFVTPRGMIATGAEQAAEFAAQIGYPVVLKIWSPDIIHKAEVGGVRKGLANAQEVMDAFDLMMYRIPQKAPKAQIVGVLVEETIRGGQEVILGMTRDPRYGPLMMFGLGGVFMEILKDVAFYLAPLTGEEAKEMLLRTRTYHLLSGGYGREGVDIEVIAEGLQRLSQLVTEFPQIREMEINPYIVGPRGVTPIAVDAHVVLQKEPGPGAAPAVPETGK